MKQNDIVIRIYKGACNIPFSSIWRVCQKLGIEYIHISDLKNKRIYFNWCYTKRFKLIFEY